MRRLALLMAVGTWCGCSEYDLSSEERRVTVPNPLPLDDEVQVDRVRQVTIPEVDVLWVIDNSCSMWEEQTALAQNFPVFMRYFVGSGLDYHIGVVSTDMVDIAHQGRLRQVSGYRFIDEDTPQPIATFDTMATMGTTGSWDERGFDATFTAIEVEGEGYNAGFVRDTAALHVVVISDENDYSEDLESSEFQAWMRSVKGASSLVSFSSIVGPEESCPGAAEPGVDYLGVTRALGGIEWPICSEDWAGVLDRLGLHTTGLVQEYFLSRVPVVDTIEVRVVEEGVTFTFEAEEDWRYDPVRNSITFVEYVPGPLAEIEIEYVVLSSRQTTDA